MDIDDVYLITVESRKFEVLGTKVVFRIISSSNHRVVDKKYITPKMIIIREDVYFTHTKYYVFDR